MNIHYIQHVPFETPAYILTRCLHEGILLSSTHLYNGESLPVDHDYDCLVIMGGPMSVNEENIFTWLKDEKRFIAEAIQRGKPVLGICLGAQLIASVLGARVYRNVKEIGWFPVHTTPGTGVPVPESFHTFHWHGETFDIPQGAVHLGSSDACPNQGFLYNRNVMALQFHLEVTEESIGSMISNCRDEMVPGPFVQDEKTIRSGMHHIPGTHAIMDRILAFLTSRK